MGSNLNLFFEWFNNIIDYCNKSHDEIPFIFTLELSKEEYNEFIDDEIAKYFICSELKRLSVMMSEHILKIHSTNLIGKYQMMFWIYLLNIAKEIPV